MVQLWKNLGVTLPEKVTGHQVAYCATVETRGREKMSDEDLLQAADRVEGWSRELNPRHLHFQEDYFRDMSFLTAALFVGLSPAVQLKYTLVRDLLQSGNQTPLEQVMTYPRVPDTLRLSDRLTLPATPFPGIGLSGRSRVRAFPVDPALPPSYNNRQ